MTSWNFFIWLLKAGLVYLALMIASIIGGAIFYSHSAPIEGFDAEAAQRVLWVISIAYALLLSVLATNTQGSRVRSALLLVALFYVVQTVLSEMEAVFFGKDLGLSMADAWAPLGAGFVTALGAAAAAVMAFPPRPAVEYAPRSLVSWSWRFAAATLLYPVVYWTAGLSIAWQSEAVREFYSQGVNVEPLPLLGFQILRGAIWAGLAVFAGYGLRGLLMRRALLVGAAFSVFMAAQLFYPNPVMPEAVRMVHLVEIGISNFIYGIVAVLLLGPSRNREAVA